VTLEKVVQAAAKALALKYVYTWRIESVYGAVPAGAPVWATPVAEPPKPRLDPRRVVVDGRYLRPGDELELVGPGGVGRATVTRVEEGRMVFAVTVPLSTASCFCRCGTTVLTDEDCTFFGAADSPVVVRRMPNAAAA
jgi:hypothetical protein